ncbi:Glyoxalase/bleomycin resistance protein/dioxygenase [Lysobacter dokdonensis DS-58]|uniref:Glyoxalase/bleomycin resistance protein/dioxygenase n=2 Tax=Noviluteimonas TaxID=3382693 RepID=A0A0A2X3Z7_9GAMM|nr:Glyoxalase/bleomycin resistance protein/dioxygenase [Lysobacter dokdonensis DS-58]
MLGVRETLTHMATLTPMLQVPDIRTTIAWYVAVGFTLLESAEEDDVLTWALLGYGDGRVMLNCGGQSSDAPRRDADLYLQVEGVDALFDALPKGVVVFEGPHDTFYGMREFIVRDNNGFWLTFGEPLRRH